MIPNFTFSPIRILENPNMVDPIYKQTFTPKSKKKRIQKKAKKLYTKLIDHKPWDKVFLVGKDTIICHPTVAIQLRKDLREMEVKNAERGSIWR